MSDFLHWRLHDQAPVTESRAASVADDDVEIVDTENEGEDAFATYFAEAHKACDREVSHSSSYALRTGCRRTCTIGFPSCLVSLKNSRSPC